MTVLCLAVLLSAASLVRGAVVYSNDFSSPVGLEWSTTIEDATPVGSNGFLGQFGATNASGQSTVLTLSSLPSHTALTVSFDLYIIASWDGHGIDVGPDIWDLSVVGDTNLLHTTFSNMPNINPGDRNQDYPSNYPGGNFVERTGCVTSNSLGYHLIVGNGPNGSVDSGDTTYHLTYTFPQSAPTVGLHFSSALTGSADEFWGIDNMVVATVPEPNTLVLASVGLLGTLVLRHRYPKN
jgi:PEP-CTERM motif